MTRIRALLAAALFSAATLATAPLAGALLAAQDAAPPPRLPSVQLPPELDRVLRDYERHWRDDDPAALADLFTPDGLIFRNGWLQGRDTIRATLRGGGDLRLRAVAWAADRDVAYIIGAYGYGDDAAHHDTGVFTLPLRRDSDGAWRIAADLDRGIPRPD